MKKTALIFATEIEALPTLKKLEAKQKESCLYIFEKGFIIISGMGCLNAFYATLNYAKDCDSLWNIGIAGALENLDLDTAYNISWIGKAMIFPESTTEHAKALFHDIHPPITLPEEGFRLLSIDYPLYCNKSKKTLATNSSLIDMEGYGFAMAANKLQKPMQITKFVSDFCQDLDFYNLKKNLEGQSEKIASFLESKFL